MLIFVLFLDCWVVGACSFWRLENFVWQKIDSMRYLFWVVYLPWTRSQTHATTVNPNWIHKNSGQSTATEVVEIQRIFCNVCIAFVSVYLTEEIFSWWHPQNLAASPNEVIDLSYLSLCWTNTLIFSQFLNLTSTAKNRPNTTATSTTNKKLQVSEWRALGNFFFIFSQSGTHRFYTLTKR